MTNPRTLVIGLGLLITGCGVGDNQSSTPDPRICQAHFTVAGTFTLGQAPPDRVNNDTQVPPADGVPDIQGCWPVGTWTFTLAQDDNTCKTAPTPLAEYKFTTTFVDDPVEPDYAYALNEPNPAGAKYRVGVSSGGGGLCTAQMELFSDDGKQTWILNPALNSFNMSGPLDGLAEYAEWKDAQTYP